MLEINNVAANDDRRLYSRFAIADVRISPAAGVAADVNEIFRF